MINTLLTKLTDHLATACWIAYLIIWIVLFIYARRWCLKKEKQIEEDFKDNTVTFLEDIDVFECQHPHVEYRAGCN